MTLRATGLLPEAGAKTKEESWPLLMTNMRMVSSADKIKEFQSSGPSSDTALMTIFSSSADFVSSYLRDLQHSTWIGLSDLLVENQYAWSDGVSPVLYTNWNDKEPNNADGAVRICNLYYVFKKKKKS